MTFDNKIYADLVNNIEINDITLKRLNVDTNEEAEHSGQLGVSIGHEIDTYERDSEVLRAVSSFNIGTYFEETGDNLFSIKVDFVIEYNVNLKKDFEEEYYEKFIQNNVPINIWPYAREIVSSLTNKMGYPPLYLPLYKHKVSE